MIVLCPKLVVCFRMTIAVICAKPSLTQNILFFLVVINAEMPRDVVLHGVLVNEKSCAQPLVCPGKGASSIGDRRVELSLLWSKRLVMTILTSTLPVNVLPFMSLTNIRNLSMLPFVRNLNTFRNDAEIFLFMNEFSGMPLSILSRLLLCTCFGTSAVDIPVMLTNLSMVCRKSSTQILFLNVVMHAFRRRRRRNLPVSTPLALLKLVVRVCPLTCPSLA